MELHRFFRYAIEKMCKEKKSLNHFAVKLGYVFSFSSFFIFPLIFGLTGFILGVVNVIKKEDLHGWVQIALSVFSLVIEFSDAFYFDELYWF